MTHFSIAPTLKQLNKRGGQTAVTLLRVYKRCISPLLGQRCRFYPSCSEFSMQVFAENGLALGAYLTLQRLARCHPFCQGGVDLPPAPVKRNDCE